MASDGGIHARSLTLERAIKWGLQGTRDSTFTEVKSALSYILYFFKLFNKMKKCYFYKFSYLFL